MSFIDDAKTAATMAVPGPGAPDEARAALDAMPIGELAAQWRMLQFVGVKAQTEETWTATRYFDDLPHESPARAYDMVLAVLAAETDMSVRLRLPRRDVDARPRARRNAGRPDRGRRRPTMPRCAGCWAAAIGGRRTRRWRSALPRSPTSRRFAPTWKPTRRDNAPIDFDALALEELARVWIEQTDKPFKDHDHNWQDFQNYQRELVEYDPDSAVDLVVAVLKIETSPFLLSVLAAGLLEDVIDMPVMERIEREAAADPRFLALLGGVWYSRKPDDVKARLDAILGRNKTT